MLRRELSLHLTRLLLLSCYNEEQDKEWNTNGMKNNFAILRNMEKKVYLRAMEPEDLDFLYKIENDNDVWDIGVTNVPYSRYVLQDYIANATCDIYTDKQLRLIVEDNDRKAVGVVDFVEFDPRHRRAELGIVISKEHRSKGYASMAVREMIGYARRTLGLHQIYAIVDNQNCTCLNLLRNAGFEDGTTLRHWLYSQDGWRDAVVMQYFLEKND